MLFKKKSYSCNENKYQNVGYFQGLLYLFFIVYCSKLLKNFSFYVLSASKSDFPPGLLV